MEWVPFLREFGLPMLMLAIGAYAVSKGLIVSGKSADQRVEEIKQSYEDQLAVERQEKAYREERRLEERANRLLTEEALRNQVNAMRDMTEVLKDVERNIRAPS